MSSTPSGFNLDEVLAPRRERSMRRLPGLIAQAVSLVWEAGPRELAISSALQLLSGAAVALQLLLGRQVIAELLSDGGTDRFTAVVPYLTLLALVSAFVAFANLGRVEQQRLLGELVARYASDRVLTAANAVDLLAYEDPAFHDRLQRASVNATVRPIQMTSGLLGVLSAIPAIAGIAVALLIVQPLFCLLVVIAYLPIWIATTRASKATYDYSVKQTERDRRRTYLYMVLTRKEEAKEVRGLGFGPWMRARHDRLYEERISDLRRVVRQRLRLGLLGGIVSSALTAGTIALLAWLVASERTSLSSAGAAAAAVILLGQRLQTLTAGGGALYESSLFLDDFTSFVAEPPRRAGPVETPGPIVPFSTLCLENVTFSYPSATTSSLRRVSIEIHRGEIVALVGANGSGKTTLAKVLAGLYPPDEGVVRWDGRDMQDLDPVAMRASITLLFQDFARYQMTVHENIGIGHYEMLDDRTRVVAAARQAGAESSIEDLPHGYDTWLGPEFFGGSDLSIGQWQRLALARAFFRDASLIVLDEPTSALDARAELELYDSIRSLCLDRSVLLISHRFSSVRSADRIYVLDRGKIVEQGNHDSLMSHRGLYAELFTLQARAYVAQ